MMKRNRHLFIVIALLGMIFACPGAPAADDPIAWNQLSPEEQQVLQPFGEKWQQLSPEQQRRLQKGARRWATLTPEERGRVRERLQRWKQMSPQQRARARPGRRCRISR